MTEPYILVVDDDDTLLAIVDSILQKNGFNTALTQNAEESFSRIEESLPQLILLDINLPETNGVETLSKLKENDDTKNIPVIMLTSESDIGSVSQCLEAGAKDYIVKPFDHNNMIARVRKILSQS